MKTPLIACPICGSEKVTPHQEMKHHHLTLGGSFSFPAVNYKCDTCGEEGDFANQNDSSYGVSLKKAQAEQVKVIIEELGHLRVTMSAFERVFELPPRTLTRWKGGDFSASSLALLRTVKTFPWLAKVAEARFEPAQANTIHIKEAVEALGTMFHKIGGTEFLVKIFQTPSMITAQASIKLSEPEEEVTTDARESVLVGVGA